MKKRGTSETSKDAKKQRQNRMKTIPAWLLIQIATCLGSKEKARVDVELSCKTLAELPYGLQVLYFFNELTPDCADENIPLFVDAVEYTAYVSFYDDEYGRSAVLWTENKDTGKIVHFDHQLIKDLNSTAQQILKEWVRRIGKGASHELLNVDTLSEED